LQAVRQRLGGGKREEMEECRGLMHWVFAFFPPFHFLWLGVLALENFFIDPFAINSSPFHWGHFPAFTPSSMAVVLCGSFV
jgi:hypothetical protein